ACQYIKEMGLPCYCTREQWNALQDKRLFKQLCIRFGLPVVKRFDIESVTASDYPVITKPADGFGSRGFSVCRERSELEKGYANAADSSPTGSVIIEQFVQNDGIVVFYTVSEGRIVFSTIEDKYPAFFTKYGTYVGGLFDFESTLADEFRLLFEDKLQALISYLKIKEGNFWIEVFHDNGKYYFNEVGFRYGGSGSLYPIDYFKSINQVAADIYYSLTGKSRINGFSNLYSDSVVKKKKYAIYPVFLKSGQIGKISGCESLLDRLNILNILPMKKEGNSIPDNGSFGQVAMLIHFVYDNLQELKDTLTYIHETLSVEDYNGNNMIIQLVDIGNFELRQKGLE
ncbi:MAG: ATP-grasp domain-containing protein, partial [Lachnospiraceae bacterium]|nr:ATP-grasp domain-containing protein [Lachnospiraceae bacterium]